MLSFAWPFMAILLPLPWIVKTAFNKYSAQDNAATIKFPHLTKVQSAYANAKAMDKKSLSWQKVLISITWAMLIFSLMRPELVRDKVYANNVGYDLMLAVDLSRSMDIVDFRDNGKLVSRIAATKKVVANFVRKRTGDRVGLIVFAEQAFLTIPLTLDTGAVSKLLNNLIVGMAGERTAIGDAIGIGVQNLRKRPEASRVLVLLTDGEDTASRIPPLEAVNVAKKSNIKIYTIGVGNNLDETLLENIAKNTDGIYYHVTDVNSLEQVYQQIDQLEKSEAVQKVVLIKTPLYHWFLAIGLLCFCIVYLARTKGGFNRGAYAN